ncbi:Integrase [Rhodovulum sp. PH10]|uniref:site-specific integrase n=1 Tax=Rhodovulum sp. PH10 TaxID=1187851 RepID=UPI00027C2C3D|nr:site-specific integrase [Rhodovulum sp. PH10]EJW11609.1 Integrase [Rhodovulum sp. PH10]
MADTRYLKQRRQGWYFQLGVPADLQAKAGRKVIVESLGTRDLVKAQKLRWPKVAQWTEAFERMRGNIPLTSAEIEEHAQRAFQSHLVEMDRMGKDRHVGGSSELFELGQQLELLADAAAAGDFGSVAREITEIEKRVGVEVPEGSREHRKLSEALMKAQYHAVMGRQHALQGRPYDPPPSFGSAPLIDPILLRPIRPAVAARPHRDGAGMRFTEAATRYIDELQRDDTAKVTEQTRMQHEAVFRLFGQYVHDAPLTDITGENASAFLEAVAKLHPCWGRSPATKKLTVWELLDRFAGGEEHLSNRTLNRYVSSLASVFKWAKKRQHYKGPNPFAEQGYAKPDPKETIWLPYRNDELSKLLRSSLLLGAVPSERIEPKQHGMKHCLMWLPLMALFTGMRSGELCQLHTDDLAEEDGVTYFRVHADREGQRVKTEAAIRHVPVHSMLIECGLLDYVRALPKGQLFPALKPGGPDQKLNWYFGKRFTTYRRSVGVNRRRVSFHSLRKNAAQALKNARATPAEIAELIGHERGFTVETYAPLELPMPALQELIERIAYPGLDLTHLLAR